MLSGSEKLSRYSLKFYKVVTLYPKASYKQNKKMSNASDAHGKADCYFVKLPNFTKLGFLVNGEGSECLRGMFKKLIKETKGSPWQNNDLDGRYMLNKYGHTLRLHSPDRQIQRGMIISGKLEKWDLSLLVQVVKHLRLKSSNLTALVDTKDLDALKDERNQLAHIGSEDMPDTEFLEKWKKIVRILTKFGVPAENLDEKTVLRIVDQMPNVQSVNIQSSNPTVDENRPLSETLKDSGNLLYKEGKYEKAISMYTEAIELPGLRSLEDLAKLYSNRSACYSKLNEFRASKSNAKLSVMYHPSSKGFYRLAKAYEDLSQFKKALKHYETALSYEPQNNQIELCIGRVKHTIVQREFYDKARREAPSQEFTEEQGIRLSQHLAGQGAAYGLYYVGRQTMEGIGVKANAIEAVRLLEEAAAQELVLSLEWGRFLNSGKADAEHYLGVWHNMGVGIPKNSTNAVKFYEAAITHGLGISCDHLAIMYRKGDGVPTDWSMAIDLWKIGAYYGCVSCTEHLAHHYVCEHDNEKAWNWFDFAVSQKSETMEMERCAFLDVLGTSQASTFDPENFREMVKNEVKTGRLNRLVCSDEILELHRQNTWLPPVPKGSSAGFRKILILRHRTVLSETWEKVKLGATVQVVVDDQTLIQLCSNYTDLFAFKPIFLDEMTATENHTYEGVVLRVTIIEDAITGCVGVPLLVEDQKGNVHRLTVFNLPVNRRWIQNVLGFGCVVSIVNPHLRMCKGEVFPMLQVIAPEKQLFFHPELREMSRCRLCGKKPAIVKCHKCGRCSYCSQQCLNDDYEYLKHELVCVPEL